MGAVPGYWLVVAVPWYWLVCRGEFSEQLVGRVRREVDELVRDWFVVRFMERGTDSQDL